MVDYAKVAQVGPLVHGLEEEKQAQADSGGKTHLEDCPGLCLSQATTQSALPSPLFHKWSCTTLGCTASKIQNKRAPLLLLRSFRRNPPRWPSREAGGLAA